MHLSAWGIMNTWWRHQMETFSALLAICGGNSPVTGEFPTQRSLTRTFHVFFDLRLNKRLSKQSWGWLFDAIAPIMTSLCWQSHLDVMNKQNLVHLHASSIWHGWNFLNKMVWDDTIRCIYFLPRTESISLRYVLMDIMLHIEACWCCIRYMYYILRRFYYITHTSVGQNECISKVVAFFLNNNNKINVPHYSPFMMGNHQWAMHYPHKDRVLRKTFPCHNVHRCQFGVHPTIIRSPEFPQTTR